MGHSHQILRQGHCTLIMEHIFADFHMNRKRFDLIAIQQSQGFPNLEHKVQVLISTLSDGPKMFDELKVIVQSEGEQTRMHIDDAFRSHKEQLEEREYRRRLFDSLWFEDIHSREEKITKAYGDTFEWIFDRSGKALGPWDNFIQWLEGGRYTYWINGKAGSGKSTLMSFLCQDVRTKESLVAWSRDKPLLVPKFFFWSAGTAMQKSVEGLLRSLIWQILQELPEMICRDSCALRSECDALHSGAKFGTWTEQRLQSTWRQVMKQAASSHCLCFFIDGIDEYEGDQDELLSLIEKTVQSTDIKICLSSRPHRAFDQAFGLSAKLRLQDLTRRDIKKFVDDQFRSVAQLESIMLRDPCWLESTMEEISRKAQGVFLWVSLAVKDQIRGLKNDDSPEQLEERLYSLPSEVEGIYQRMLDRIERPYWEEASLFFGLMFCAEKVYLLDLALASRGRLLDLLDPLHRLPEQDLITSSHLIRKRITTVCAGLLEVNDETEDYEETTGDDSLVGDHIEVSEDRERLTDDGEEVAEDLEGYSDDDEEGAHNDEELGEDFNSDDGDDSIIFSSVQGEATEPTLLALKSRPTITFIHRTAFDFMQNSDQGGAFLQHQFVNSSPRCSRETYIQILIARLKLFGTTLSVIYDLMKCLWDTENRTGVAPSRFCALLDGIMCKLDMSYCGEHKDLRWNARLSRDNLQWWSCIRLGVGTLKNDCPDLQSLLEDRFKEQDFLCFAASHGLLRYVLQNLPRANEVSETEAASRLLHWSVFSLDPDLIFYPATPVRGVNRVCSGLYLVDELLRRRGSLGPHYQSTWSFFLVRTFSFLQACRFSRLDKWVVAETKQALLRTIRLFLEYGADLSIIFSLKLESMHVHYLDQLPGDQLPGDFVPRSQMSFTFKVHLSALNILQLCLNDQHWISDLSHQENAKDARCGLRCIELSMRVRRSPSRQRQHFTIGISDPESDAFLDGFKRLCMGETREVAESHGQKIGKLAREILRERITSIGYGFTQGIFSGGEASDTFP